MQSSHAEKVLEKLRVLLDEGCQARVERNSVLPEKIPVHGLIVIYDGDPGEPEQVLGGFNSAYYEHQIEVILYMEEGNSAQRDQKFDGLLLKIGEILEDNPTLDGLVAGLSYARPETAIEPVLGGPAIKTGTLVIIAEYDTASPLS